MYVMLQNSSFLIKLVITNLKKNKVEVEVTGLYWWVIGISTYYSFTSITVNKTRNSSGDEIANVNFLCDDIVHALKIQ